jgi:2-iminoacetate synthase ThiH
VKSYKDNFIEGVHYYMEGERVIFMALFHLERGQCCGNGCRHCPFEPKHKKGTANVKDKNSPEYIKFKENT